MASNHELFEGMFENPRTKVIVGQFAPDGTDPPTGVTGGYFTVERDDVGTFVVTLTERILASAVHFDATLRVPSVGAEADNDAKPGPVDLAAGTFTIFTVDTTDGAAVDLAADASTIVSFIIVALSSD